MTENESEKESTILYADCGIDALRDFVADTTPWFERGCVRTADKGGRLKVVQVTYGSADGVAMIYLDYAMLFVTLNILRCQGKTVSRVISLKVTQKQLSDLHKLLKEQKETRTQRAYNSLAAFRALTDAKPKSKKKPNREKSREVNR